LAEKEAQSEPVSPPLAPEWAEVINEVASASGVVMVLGAAGAGKPTICAQLANAAFETGTPTAIVDADVGQSEIGAPGTIGMGLVDRPIEVISDVKPKRLYFIGATSPVRHMLECCVGCRRMVDAAREHDARMIVLDTTGLVDGHLGSKLKTYKTDLVRPDYIIAVQRRKEVEHVLAPFAKVEEIKIRRVPSSELVRRRPQEIRAARRRANFYRHFNDAPGHMIRLDDVSLWNTSLGTGRLMKWQYMKFMEDTLKCRILHAEVTGRGIFAVAEQQCLRSGLREIEEEFRTKNVQIIAGEALNNLFVGLADARGNTINVGLIQAIDIQQRIMFVISPIKTVTPVCVVQFGSMRVTKEGRELGTLGPGDI